MTSATQLSSDLILSRLLIDAENSSRPDVRRQTIERLVAACDAIAAGQLLGSASYSPGKPAGAKVISEINATNVELFVKQQQKVDSSWTGPVRVSIARDVELSNYVTAREAERAKSLKPARATDRHKLIASAIASMPQADDRRLLIDVVEEGRRRVRERDLMYKFLRIEGTVDLDRLLSTGSSGKATAASASQLTGADRSALKTLLARITDNNELNRLGLEIDGSRIRSSRGVKAIFMKSAEVQMLMRLAGTGVEPTDGGESD